MKYFTFIFSVLILISPRFNLLSAQESLSIVQEEAPATLWDINLGDSDVDLYIDGYWKMGLMGGLSIESGPEGITFPAVFPGLTDFRFYQEPDLTLSLWLMNRFYLETSFLDGFDKNTYAVGYRGAEGEVVQSVRIGNSEIHIDEYKGINVPAPQYNTPGISALFQTKKSTHDVLFRYDPTSEQKKTFLGEYEITEELLQTGNYVSGQYFILPDSELDFIEIYIADKKGIYSGNDGKTYRKAISNEAFYSLSDGTVTLAEPSETAVLVFYTKGGSDIGSGTLGTSFVTPLVNGEPDPASSSLDFNWTEYDSWLTPSETYDTTRAVTLNGRKALKIYDPGKFGPFEYFNTYKVSTPLPVDQWRTEVFLVDNSQVKAADSDSYKFKLNIDEKIISVHNSVDTDIRSPWSRYPLADSYPLLYGSAETDKALVGRSVMVSVKNKNGITLGSGVVPGSEQIYINGYKTSAASVDYENGQITFSKFIFPHDRIVVHYRTETTDLSGGDLLFAQGNRFYPSEYLELHLAEMFRWNISKKSSSTVDSTSPGGLTIGGGLKYKRENTFIELTTTMNLLTPDTTGYLRLQGMEESGYSFSIGNQLLKQAPDAIWDGSTPLLSGDRTSLDYYDYYSTDGLGQYFLNSYNWPSATMDPGKEGPSIASRASEDDFHSNVLVMDYDIASNKWAAGDLLLSADGPIDLSRFTSISLQFKRLSSDGTDTEIKILIGENGERKDWDENGFIDRADQSLIVAIPHILTSSDGFWEEFEYSFSPAEMDKLTKTRSVRIVLDNTDLSTHKGKLLVGGLQFEGSISDISLYNASDIELSGDRVKISETDDTTAIELASQFDEIDDIFHPSGEKQKALKISWSSLDTTDYWIAVTNTSPVPADTYKKFSFYIKNDTNSQSGTYDISLTDSQDRGYSFHYSPTSTNWEKLTLSLETGKITDSSGTQIGTALKDKTTGELTKYSIQGSGTTTGTMYIDELHYSDPTFSIDGSVELISEFAYPGIIAETEGGFPLLANFSISNQFSYNGGTIISEISEESHALQNNTSLSIDLILLEVDANMKINLSQSSSEFSGNHGLSFPAGFTYGNIKDSYSRDGDNETQAMNRSNSLNVILPDTGKITLSAAADGNDDTLLQKWRGETNWEIASRFNIGGILNFEQDSQWDNRDKGNYLSNWISDYSLIAPVSDSVRIRSVKSSLNLNLRTEPVGFTLIPYLSFVTENSPDQKQTNRGGFTSTLPIKLISKNETEWLLTPSYSRSFVEKSDSDTTGSFTNGFNNLFHDLAIWIPTTSFIPFFELFADETTEKFEKKTNTFNEASYSPDFGLNISRKFGSRIFDLFLPYSFDIHLVRNFGKKDDTFYNENRFEFAVKQTAVNLFGEFGVYRKFDFYNTDEFTGFLQFIMKSEDENIPEPSELTYQNYFSFYGNNNSALILENKFSSDFENTVLSDSLNFKFIHQNPMRERFKLKFINDLIDKEHFWSHEENLQLQLTYPWAESENTEFTSLNISAQHLSKLNVPGLGALKTWLTIGFYGNEELFRAGFEAGLELEISF